MSIPAYLRLLFVYEIPVGSSLRVLIIVVSLWVGWEILASSLSFSTSNPFAPLLFVSHRAATSSLDDSRYQKGYLDLVFIAFYIVVWSFIRQFITIWGFKPLARWYGIRKEGKLDRFGEQGYAVAYFAFTGLWGLVSLLTLRIDSYSTSSLMCCRESCLKSQRGIIGRSTSG